MWSSINLIKEEFKKQLSENVRNMFRRDLKNADMHQIYLAVCNVLKDEIIDTWMETQKKIENDDPKIVYYMSMEFLTGRYLGNNLLSLSYYDVVKEALNDLGIDINGVEDEERDPALGNGGLGRLAACFIDSLSTLSYPAYGCGIRYHYGMFKQKIKNGYQEELPDNWLADGYYPFELKRPEHAKEIRFGGTVVTKRDEKTGKDYFIHEGYEAVKAVPYDLPVIGYGNGVVNTLRIWDAEPMTEFHLMSFDKGDYFKASEQAVLAKNITDVLYPNDNHIQGKELRLKQQYFFVSASIQTAIDKYKRHHDDLSQLPDKVVFQMNDTHPTIAVTELMRILIDEEGLDWDEAWDLTTSMCAYTNHTIMSEALEKWPIDLFSRLFPRIYQIVEEINRRFCKKINDLYPGQQDKIDSMAILYDGQVRMANLAIAGSFSVNGVAKLHTDILKRRELKDFYEMTPEKFNNKTNGVTQRRFLLHGNPLLSDWITSKIGPKWVTDLSELKKLLPLTEDDEALSEFMSIKHENKKRLADYILKNNGITVDPNSIFDAQVKRLHEYKRQFLNVLHIISQYLRIKKDPDAYFYPKTYIFGAKASSGYYRAKNIIKLINSVADVVNNDPDVNGRIKVVFIEDYRVSNAELIFAAADISEQISTASREASGTGNMKFMMNGALTLGTMDGANVEIIEEVGEVNAFVFGLSADEVMQYEKTGTYRPWEIVEQEPEIKEVLNTLIDGSFSGGDTEIFRDLYDSLLYRDRPDMYFILADFKDYARAQNEASERYSDKKAWATAALINTAMSGRFSSDRTIEDYVEEIWHLEKIK